MPTTDQLKRAAGKVVFEPVRPLETAGNRMGGAASGEMREPETAIGAYCSETQRVAVISAFPERVHALVGELSARCLDVLVFHRFDPAVMNGLPVELIILDAVAADAAGESAELKASAAGTQSRASLLWLVHEQTPAHLVEEGWETLVWPGPLEEAVARTLELLSRGAEAAALSPGTAVQEREAVSPASGHAVSTRVFKDLALDAKRMTVTRASRRIDVTKTEFELLLLLMEAEGAVLSREEIMDRVWGSHYFGGSNVVDVHVKSLRKKLGDPAAAPVYIVTVRGVGYRLADE
ncbi:DNA-binding response regulator, OmpR family, contains REC and winged-helix (wHTH) domain [Paenibacillus sp. UNCCL117]|uniref:winged helix-turn-helix domain-containing protein n=1 Tax=unclassified Paenibacillus TaxID=185978 RepID=UPI0008896BB5|nr:MULTISPECIES: winged helix-turn-helix domain-containing protein [unclassified Paenibacillus]SDD14235.1 DNA-binding response regulator, OmpR family, contains REC and winged-helix (wHTH) domain [Paenibacillus sp. cl123]SFW34177.1 DNA-binding response regulator, OmpR family, contains REC and winged-helix (wHTH) domain [Paenibacillus sp. UNCCL117]